MKSFRAFLAALFALSLLGACQTTSSSQADLSLFDEIADDLLVNLPGPRRVAIRPFRADEVPVPLSVAERFNDALAIALERRGGGRIQMVARRELPKLFEEAEEFHTVPDLAYLLEDARADVLVIGDVRIAGGAAELTYRAADPRTGTILAQARPRLHPYDATASEAVALGRGLDLAAARLIEQAPDLRHVMATGIVYAHSGVQTALGRYVGDAVTGLLRERIRGLQTDAAAVLRDELTRVGDLARGGAEAQMAARPGAYVLSGSYWPFGGDVEIRLTLRGPEERTASATTRVRADTLSAAMRDGLVPAEAAPGRGMDNLGPITLWMDSNRGKRPVYRIGDLVTFIVQASRDGYLYCFNQASPKGGGAIVRIFPNRWQRDARIRGRARLFIPDDKMDFNLRAHGPAGAEPTRCFVVDRDVKDALPPEILAADLSPLPVASLDDLGRIFRSLPGAAVSEATLVVNIRE